MTAAQTGQAQSLAQGAAGVALLHIERAHAGLGSWSAAHTWIQAATRSEVSAADQAGLFVGAPAIAFILHAAGSRYDRYLPSIDAAVASLAHRRVDAALARIHRREPAAFAEYDLLHGLTGIGRLLLRHAPGDDALGRILTYLVRLRLLARFELTEDEVGCIIDRTTAIPIKHTDLLRNPYLLVTSTVDGAPVPFTIVDRGCFPEPALAARHPLPIDQSFADVIDPRRIEAALTSVIATAEADGHTLLPVSQAIERVRGLAVAQPLDLTRTVLTGLGLAPDDLDNDPDPDKAPLARTTLADRSHAYKLRSAIIRAFSITEFLDYRS